jgi:metal-responsive CopG/Arc/MetJ family transcriptional regulator
MTRSAKIAISLDTELLRSVERVREQTGESRSAVVSRALRQLTREDEHARRVLEYVQAYRATPETATEVAAARSSAKRALAALPWDEE